MKVIAILIILLSLGLLSFGDEDQGAPRWFFLGDDDALKETYSEAHEVLLICIYATELEDIRPPFASVVHKATVVRSLKGELVVGDKIEIAFRTDSLPSSEVDRKKFIEKANFSAEGDLRFAFLQESKDKRFWTEFLYVPDYSKEMSVFLGRLDPKTTRVE